MRGHWSRPQTNFTYFPKYQPAEGTNAAVKFAGLRHAPLAAQRKITPVPAPQKGGWDFRTWPFATKPTRSTRLISHQLINHGS
jgi:hypothetical protein